MSNVKQITGVQNYTIQITHYDDDTTNMYRKNEGFSNLELIGLCAFIEREITEQMSGAIRPDIIKRECVEDK